jgi:hypothetical protein
MSGMYRTIFNSKIQRATVTQADSHDGANKIAHPGSDIAYPCVLPG